MNTKTKSVSLITIKKNEKFDKMGDKGKWKEK